MDRQIVVCDAEPHVVRAISLKFMRADFDVKGATDIETCWRLLHGHEPQELLILSDALPSAQDTLQLIQLIRSDARLADLPIIMLTSTGLESIPQQAELANLNIVHIVSKPFSPRELLALACDLLDHEPQRRSTNVEHELNPNFANRDRTSGRVKPS